MILYAFIFSAIFARADEQVFGEKIDIKNPMTVEQAIAAKAVQEPIVIEGVVEKVCQKKGCWMTLKSKAGEVRMTFKDYGFFVPPTLVGAKVWAKGILSEKVLSTKEAKHYAEDSGADPSQVRAPTREIHFVASTVKKVNPAN